jgi:hypothetical protein
VSVVKGGDCIYLHVIRYFLVIEAERMSDEIQSLEAEMAPMEFESVMAPRKAEIVPLKFEAKVATMKAEKMLLHEGWETTCDECLCVCMMCVCMSVCVFV